MSTEQQEGKFEGKYCMGCVVPLDFDAATAKTKEALAANGFGVLSSTDFREKFKAKIDKDLGYRYVVLGACAPKLAWAVVQSDHDAGVLLPCNVLLREVGH